MQVFQAKRNVDGDVLERPKAKHERPLRSKRRSRQKRKKMTSLMQALLMINVSGVQFVFSISFFFF